MKQIDSNSHHAARRTAVLARYAILDTPPEAEFDAIVRVAAVACGVPVSLINLLDGDRQWAKAMFGDGPKTLSLDASICALAVRQEAILEIPDTAQDPRTAGNPLVTADVPVRFYAGVPLQTPDGVVVGTLCVADGKPGRLTDDQRFTLETLARQVMTTLELRRSLRQHRRSDHRSSAILESAVDYAIVSMDLTGLVTSWNSGAEHILGWSAQEMCGQPARAFFTERDVADGIPEREMGQALLHGRGNDERWHARKNGDLFWAFGEMMPLLDEGGTPEGFIKVLRDHTEQRLDAERQREDAEFMRSVLAASADCIKVLDLDAKLTFMSEGGQRVMEVSDFNAIRGCPWPDFWVGDGNVAAKAAIATARAGGIGAFQGTADTMAGNSRWWDVQVTPILDGEGRPEKLLSVSRDITRQKTAEGLLTASEARWRGLFTGMQEGFFLGEIIRDAAGCPTDYRFVEINPAFAAQSGLPSDTAGRTIRSLVPQIRQDLIDTYARTVDTGEPCLFEIEVPDLRRWFEVRARKDVGQRFSCLFLDITERKVSEVRRSAMAALGDRLRDVTEKAAIGPIVGEILGRTFDLAHAGYGAVDPERETVTVPPGWTAPGFAPLAGIHHFREYGSYIDALKAGTTVVIADTCTDPRTRSERVSVADLGGRSLVNLPILEQGRFVTLFFALKPEPHDWTDDEIGFLRDVADRTRATIARLEAEEEQRVLNLELSHRMKNMLAMVQSIATQTLRNATDMAMAKDVLAGRLVALGRSHDLLLGGSLGATFLHTLVDSALQPHLDRPDRFVVTGPEVSIGAKAAMSLALMLHELATNAAKYGASSTAAGTVTVRWEVEERQDGERCRIRWTEADGPAVVPPTRQGFGTRLIGRGLAGNFGGEATLRYPVTGLVCEIDAPLKGLQAEDAPPLLR